MIMEQYRLQIAFAIMAIIAFFAILGWAGDIDYCDQVILSMTQEEYDSVKSLLTERQGGVEPSDRKIAHYWVEHMEDRD